MKIEIKQQIKDIVLKEIIEDLEKLDKISGEMELEGKEYIVIPVKSNFQGFVEKAIELTFKQIEIKENVKP